MENMKSKIKQKLDEYLEFDSDVLFKHFNAVKIFGGAIRDIIANQKINDIDILCGSIAHKYLEEILKYNGYKYFDYLAAKDIQSLYKDIKIISEPHTWIKNDKIVQLIRPRVVGNASFANLNYNEVMHKLIHNVDMSCCGVSYDAKDIHEDYPNAILHCHNMVYSVNKSAYMYSSERFLHRQNKLDKRGWKEIEGSIEANRDLKLNNIIYGSNVS